jgi:hypothetical protein
MSTQPKKRLHGRIVTVQENRFRLVRKTGQGYLFTLHHASRTNIEDLQRWQEDDTRLTVEYTGEPNIASGIAHHIAPSG